MVRNRSTYVIYVPIMYVWTYKNETCMNILDVCMYVCICMYV